MLATVPSPSPCWALVSWDLGEDLGTRGWGLRVGSRPRLSPASARDPLGSGGDSQRGLSWAWRDQGLFLVLDTGVETGQTQERPEGRRGGRPPGKGLEAAAGRKLSLE